MIKFWLYWRKIMLYNINLVNALKRLREDLIFVIGETAWDVIDEFRFVEGQKTPDAEVWAPSFNDEIYKWYWDEMEQPHVPPELDSETCP